MLSHEPQVLYYWQTYHFARLNELFKTSTIMGTLKYDLAPKKVLLEMELGFLTFRDATQDAKDPFF